MRSSESDRLLLCSASLVLPRDERPSGDAARFGTLVHHWAETGESDPEWADPSHIACLQKKLAITGLSPEDLFSGGESEVTFAIDLRSATGERYRGQRSEADGWKAKWDRTHYLTGTIDYLYPDGSGGDLKTGSWPVYPDRSAQLRSYALLPWIEAGRPIGWAREWSIVTWKRYPVAGLPSTESAVFTGMELLDHLENLRWAAERAEVNPGREQCRFCPARCPDRFDSNQ